MGIERSDHKFIFFCNFVKAQTISNAEMMTMKTWGPIAQNTYYTKKFISKLDYRQLVEFSVWSFKEKKAINDWRTY